MPMDFSNDIFAEFERLYGRTPGIHSSPHDQKPKTQLGSRNTTSVASSRERMPKKFVTPNHTEPVERQAILDAKKLRIQYQTELALDEDERLDPIDLSAWFYVRAELMKWSQITTGRYRRGLVALTNCRQPDIQPRLFPLHLAQFYEKLDSRAQPLISPGDLAKRPRANRARKRYRGAKAFRQKFCSADQFTRITDHLETRTRSELAEAASAFLKAELATGLRPSEWRATSMRKKAHHPDFYSAPFLDVLTPVSRAQKDSQVVLRSLNLTNLSPDTLKAINLTSDMASATFRRSDAEWNTLRTRLSELIDRACVAIFGANGSRFALDTFRHQCLANYAQGGITIENVSAFFGDVGLLIGDKEYLSSDAAWAFESLPASASPSELDIKTAEAFSTAYNIHKANYLNLIDGRNVGITQAQLEKLEREGSLDF